MWPCTRDREKSNVTECRPLNIWNHSDSTQYCGVVVVNLMQWRFPCWWQAKWVCLADTGNHKPASLLCTSTARQHKTAEQDMWITAVVTVQNIVTSWHRKTRTLTEQSTWSKLKTLHILHRSSNCTRPPAGYQPMCLFGHIDNKWFLSKRDKTAIIAVVGGGCLCVCVRDMLPWRTKKTNKQL